MREELNAAVLAPIGMEKRTQELRRTIQALLQARISGGGLYAGVIIGTEPNERQQILNLRGTALVEEKSTRKITLDDFVR
jgi:hypothetical protein